MKNDECRVLDGTRVLRVRREATAGMTSGLPGDGSRICHGWASVLVDNEQAAELETAQVGTRLHCCTQSVDLGLTRVRMPAMREAELHIARGRLTLEERHVNTHHG
eukprot:CAMPEP_0204146816 /NCGR_PEP_ID=MMETSP0361-20130328/22343_1 /ASSEMBLY_ACC=CAM_ASM_000343 /TAXON_ID=268821 /ORGANISM="Scrippsiella Hangoei, Strain SHTV-5" /LENGTH=105 /DNA_ID=CAMNT_0051100939 /DNA_START=154 /DNA_END=466 /DNA_ORIENTATION=+